MNSIMKKTALSILLLAGMATCNHYVNKKYERGIEIQPKGVVDMNRDGVKDYLTITINDSPSLTTSLGGFKGYGYVHYFNGNEVTISNEGKYLAHTPGMRLISTEFKKQSDYDMIISEVPSKNPGFINLKISEITPDFPVTIDHLVSTRKLN